MGSVGSAARYRVAKKLNHSELQVVNGETHKLFVMLSLAQVLQTQSANTKEDVYSR